LAQGLPSRQQGQQFTLAPPDHRCTRFAFSTDGSRHDHPDAETIARILKNDPERLKTLIFNFRQPQTEQWDDDALKRRWRYDCLFPEQDGAGIEFDI
jgi:hypothetical protein